MCRVIDVVTDGVSYLFGRRGGGVVVINLGNDEKYDSPRDRIVFGLKTTKSEGYGLLVRMASGTSNDFIDIALVQGCQLCHLYMQLKNTAGLVASTVHNCP